MDSPILLPRAPSAGGRVPAQSHPSCPRRLRSRTLATARIWSLTATAGRPSQLIGIRIGGLAFGELDNGTTITVLRRSLSTFTETTTQGRVLRISEPRAGSSATHQTSIADSVKFFFDLGDIEIRVGGLAGSDQLMIAGFQLRLQCLADETRAITRWNPAKELYGQLLRNAKRHFPYRHKAIIRELGRSGEFVICPAPSAAARRRS